VKDSDRLWSKVRGQKTSLDLVSPCEYRGRPISPPDGNPTSCKWYECDHPDQPLGKQVCARRGCGAGCRGYVPDDGQIDVAGRHRIADELLHGGDSTAHFNSSLLRYQGRLLLAYRTGWAGAHCHIAELDESLTPISTTKLAGLVHPNAGYGREDPRLFLHNGRLHISYIGVEKKGVDLKTNQMYALLRDDLSVEHVFSPKLQARQMWEKNWSFFSHDRNLYATYSISPRHQILKIDGDSAVWEYETHAVMPWSGGPLRGGAPPVLLGGEYYHFFHGRIGNYGPKCAYNVGCYTFEANPPFRVLRSTHHPILTANQATKIDKSGPAVVFPCGAMLLGDRWRISAGIHDRWTEILDILVSDVEERLQPVEG
jgi:predicted GH43/DUF377 family glycosyl hydrolase